jgi:hypothetical protein
MYELNHIVITANGNGSRMQKYSTPKFLLQYHGKTIIHEVENGERLNVHITNEDTGQTFDATNILPEYFFISIPLFNDRLVKEIDDWLYVMKHDQVPDKFHSPYMKQVSEKLNILKMTQEERDNYAYYQKKLYNDRDELNYLVGTGVSVAAIFFMRENLDKNG